MLIKYTLARDRARAPPVSRHSITLLCARVQYCIYKITLQMPPRRRGPGRPRSTAEVVHACRACGRRFKQLSNVKRHYDSQHAASRRFPCRDCDVRFYTRESRNQHALEVHPHRVSYRCGKCDYGTNSTSELALHAKQEHPGPRLQPSRRRRLADLPPQQKAERLAELQRRKKDKETVRRQRRRMAVLTTCVRCGSHFTDGEGILRHMETKHPTPAGYKLEATAFGESCQCWVKRFPDIAPRSEDEPWGSPQEEKTRAAKNFRKSVEAERASVHSIVGNTLQTHRSFKFAIIPFVRMRRVQVTDAAGQNTRADLEQVFKLRSQQYIASASTAAGKRQTFHAQYNAMRNMIVARLEDRLLEEVRRGTNCKKTP